jgi:uncharacterized protein DUF6798
MPGTPEALRLAPPKGDYAIKNLILLALLAVLAFLVIGYHPGLEDDSFYLAAVKRQLNPSLFPHDADYFRLQFQATIFDKLIAWSIRLTHLPVTWAELLWQLAALFFLLHGCWGIARRCFTKPEARWASTALVAALLSMPIGGIAINLADQYLHPRMLATAAILAAVVAVIDRRVLRAGILLAFAFALHAIMASFGISLCIFLYWTLHKRDHAEFAPRAASLIPLGWLFEPASDAWRQAASTRGFYFLGRWQWYEWLGVFAPLVLLFVLNLWLRSRGPQKKNAVLVSLVTALVYYGVFQMLVGFIIMLPHSLERLRPFEPMRYLHLLYILFFLISGGLLGEYVLRRHVYRWALLFVPLSAGMLFAQIAMYPASPHLELPFMHPQDGWLAAFAWIRQNTPTDDLFAIDPHYETLPGEDQHGFRALAERSVLADYEKDGGMAARVPSLAPRWLSEVTALNGWQNFGPADFDRLNKDFGVTWFVFSRADAQFSDKQADHFSCLYRNDDVKVCRFGRPPEMSYQVHGKQQAELTLR